MSTPVGPYSPAVRAGQWLATSGQLGVEPGPDGPVLVAGGFVEQARQALANVDGLLTGRGFAWSDVVKATAFLTDIGDYPAFNEIYLATIGDARPARSVVAVAALPLGALVEVEVWAYRA